MVLTAHARRKDIITDSKTLFIIQKVKEIVSRYDKHAEIILFGSRARGDWHDESDWDFLVLSPQPETSGLKERIRKDILVKIELTTFDNVFTLVHNKEVWEQEYSVTNIYESIREEGIAV